MSSVCTVGVSEALNMGVQYGLDPKTLAGVIDVSSGRCYNSLEQNPIKGVTPGAASKTDFVGGFSVDLCKGLLEMAMALGKGVGAQSVLIDRILTLYEKTVKDKGPGAGTLEACIAPLRTTQCNFRIDGN